MLAKETYNSYTRTSGARSLIVTGALLFCFLLGLAYFSSNLFIIIIIGLLPALVAISVDNNPQKYLPKIVTIFNLVGVFPYAMKILFSFKSADTIALKMLGNPSIWLTIYLSAAFGWLMYLFIPKIVLHYTTLNIQLKTKELTEELNNTMNQWSGAGKIEEIIRNYTRIDP